MPCWHGLRPHLNIMEVNAMTQISDAGTQIELVCVLMAFLLFAPQPMKLGEHLNSLLLNMCDDVTLSRLSLRTVLDICSKHIRNSSFDPPFSNIRKLVRLVLGSLSQVSSFIFFFFFSPMWVEYNIPVSVFIGSRFLYPREGKVAR